MTTTDHRPDLAELGLYGLLLRLDFIEEGANPIIVGPNGIGKSMIARNIAYGALLAGHTVRFTTASDMLNDLASQDSASGLRRQPEPLQRGGQQAHPRHHN